MASIQEFYLGKVVVITGGSSGIGLSLAKILSSFGAHVVILARRPEGLARAVQEIKKSSHPASKVLALSVDVKNETALQELIGQITGQLDIPDFLFNSAGVVQPGEFVKLTAADFQEMMDVNYFGTVYAIQAVLPGMLTAGHGHIVNISSMAGYLNIYGYTAYGASKYAIAGLSDALRMELHAKGLRVSVVFPPDTDTPQLAYDNQHKPYVTKALSGTGGTQKPDQVALEILSAVKKGKYAIYPGIENKLIHFAVNLLGRRIAYAIMDNMMWSALKRYPGREK